MTTHERVLSQPAKYSAADRDRQIPSRRQSSWVERAELPRWISVVIDTVTGQSELGLTLPSGDYLKHQPQYIPPSPSFPLSRELESIEEVNCNQQQDQDGGF